MEEKAKGIEKVIQSLLKSWGLDRFSREQRVFTVWEKALGDLSRQARPVMVDHGRLVVAVKDNAWLQELQFQKEEIKKKLNRELGPGVIQELRFKLGSWEDNKPPETETPSPSRALPPSLVAEAEAMVSVIKDQRLRELVLKAILAAAEKEGERLLQSEDTGKKERE